MIYGFAKQSGGHVSIYSEEGKGTTVKLYLPRDAGVARPMEKVDGAEVPRGRGEVVLVIEDDAEVRAATVKTLEGLGYQPIDVGDAAGARDVLDRGDKIDLVLSDVVLPGDLSGPEFAAEIRERRPRLAIVFMSGYPAAARNGFLDSDRVLLNKPFRRRQLAEALGEALGR